MSLQQHHTLGLGPLATPQPKSPSFALEKTNLSLWFLGALIKALWDSYLLPPLARTGKWLYRHQRWTLAVSMTLIFVAVGYTSWLRWGQTNWQYLTWTYWPLLGWAVWGATRWRVIRDALNKLSAWAWHLLKRIRWWLLSYASIWLIWTLLWLLGKEKFIPLLEKLWWQALLWPAELGGLVLLGLGLRAASDRWDWRGKLYEWRSRKQTTWQAMPLGMKIRLVIRTSFRIFVFGWSEWHAVRFVINLIRNDWASFQIAAWLAGALMVLVVTTASKTGRKKDKKSPVASIASWLVRLALLGLLAVPIGLVGMKLAGASKITLVSVGAGATAAITAIACWIFVVIVESITYMLIPPPSPLSQDLLGDNLLARTIRYPINRFAALLDPRCAWHLLPGTYAELTVGYERSTSGYADRTKPIYKIRVVSEGPWWFLRPGPGNMIPEIAKQATSFVSSPSWGSICRTGIQRLVDPTHGEGDKEVYLALFYGGLRYKRTIPGSSPARHELLRGPEAGDWWWADLVAIAKKAGGKNRS